MTTTWSINDNNNNEITNNNNINNNIDIDSETPRIKLQENNNEEKHCLSILQTVLETMNVQYFHKQKS
jgi:hypothetical protein